jgi:predicted GNAT family N-acyltransferase
LRADKNKYKIEPLGQHNRAAFLCGKEFLDRYIREQVSQDVKRQLAGVFVITAKEAPNTVLAYYSLSSKELKVDRLPPEILRKAGKYGSVGVTLLGRLAVANQCKGTGLGELTMMHALEKSLDASRNVASWAVFVEALDIEASNFYRKYGFIELPEDSLKLFLPMKTVAQLFNP